MPKLKTHKGAQRRFRVTGSGKVMQCKVGKSHLRCKKPSRVKRQYSGMTPVSPSNKDQLKKLLPYKGR